MMTTTTTTASYYQSSSNMNAHNTQTNYMTTSHPQPSTYATPAATSGTYINRAYILSLRGILKIACLIFCLISFLCLVVAPQCGNHIFLSTVAWLVIIMQGAIIVAFVFGFQRKFAGIDFDFLDFFATSHDALYLLIASSITLNYCHLSGQIAGGIMGLLAFASLVGSAVALFMTRRGETTTNANSSSDAR